jgi:hypothetical protein
MPDLLNFTPERNPKLLGRREDRARLVEHQMKATEPAALIIRIRAEEKRVSKLMEQALELGLDGCDQQATYSKILATLREQLMDLLGVPKRPSPKLGKGKLIELPPPAEIVQ